MRRDGAENESLVRMEFRPQKVDRQRAKGAGGTPGQSPAGVPFLSGFSFTARLPLRSTLYARRQVNHDAHPIRDGQENDTCCIYRR